MTADAYREILVAFASSADQPALARAVGLALAHSARLTVVVPVVRPSPLIGLAGESVRPLEDELTASAQRIAQAAISRVPHDVPVVMRLMPRWCEPGIRREIAEGAFDLCIAQDGRRDPGTVWGRAGLRIVKQARRSGVATLVVARVTPGADKSPLGALPVPVT